MRFLATALVFSICFPNSAYSDTSPRIHALLVGIAAYPQASVGLQPLDGPVNDAKAFAGVLRSRYGLEDGDIEELHDAQATRKTILAKFRSHLVLRARKGDTAIFYFAGHGSQVKDNDGDEGDLLDETIVPYDGRMPGEKARDIVDDELREHFEMLTENGVHVVVILDACHAGSGQRARATARRADPLGKPAAERTSSEPQDLLLKPGKGPMPVLLAAAQSHQLAYESEFQGVVYGRFTRALVDSLQRSGPRETYLDLFAETAARLRADGTGQRPAAEGNLTTLVFNGLQSSNRPVFTGERIESSRFRLSAGAVVGMVAGSVLHGFESAAAAAGLVPGKGQRATLVEVTAGQSVAVVEKPEMLPNLAYFMETHRAYGETVVTVDLSGLRDSDLVTRARSAIAAVEGVEESSKGNAARMRLVADEHGFSVLRDDGSAIFQNIDPSKACTNSFVELFERVLRRDAFLSITNTAEGIKVGVSLMVIGSDKKTYSPTIIDGLSSLAIGQQFRFCIKNSSRPDRVFVHGFAVKDAFWIYQLFPTRGANAEPVERYAAFSPPQLIVAEEAGTTILRFIVTDETIPSELLEHRDHGAKVCVDSYFEQKDDLGRTRSPPLCLGSNLSALESLICRVRDGRRSGPVTVEEWETISLLIAVTGGPPSHSGVEVECI
ncbi:MAG: caspase family protein [Halopseudomonas sp.]